MVEVVVSVVVVVVVTVEAVIVTVKVDSLGAVFGKLLINISSVMV